MRIPLAFLGIATYLLTPATAAADLKSYVDKPEPKYRWELVKKTTLPSGCLVYDLKLISQEWQQILWEHDVQVFIPKEMPAADTLFLWNQGGKASLTSQAFGSMVAERIKGPVALLFGNPKQPLLGGKREDALIAETFIRFLETKDASWPLLFPMVKSVVKCMDCLQEFSQKEMKQPVKQFIVAGASKRGWTTWLTAAIDPRVKAIAPLVIDTLNMQKQLPHQLEMFGGYSEQIGDYTARGLVPMPDLPAARQLWGWVDPWVYREKYTMPKLIINGANDPYWTVDALNQYWDDLPEPKWIIIVPNAGHNLEQDLGNGQKSRDRAINGLAAFARLQLAGKLLPKIDWHHFDKNDQMQVRAVIPGQQPKFARLWIAHHPTKDFRKAIWNAKAVEVEQRQTDVPGVVFYHCKGQVPPPESGYVAFYLEFEFEIDGMTFPLCTQVRVAGK